jgi:RecJ-like exonuclease
MSSLKEGSPKCPFCGGDGWYQETGSEHGCDGTEEMCIETCPVPVPIQVQCQACEGTGTSLKCPWCNITLTPDDNRLVCENCGYWEDMK